MKHYYLSIFLAILLSMACAMASAHDIAVANSDGKIIYYNYNSDGSSVTVTYQGESYDSYSDEYIGDIAIPESVNYSGNTYSVTSIGNKAFDGCSGLTSVTIPNSVTSIADLTFYGCSGLTSVTIPNSVTSIGASAFSGCSGLTSVVIPNSVTSISDRAFSDCSGLTSVTIPSSVTSIGHYAFDGCSGLTSIVIPNSVTSIGSGAFIQCSSLTSVTIPNSVTSISSQTFSRCISLTSVTIPNSVVSIDHKAFEGCYKLTSITIPNSVTTIGQVVFGRCLELTKIEVDKGNSVYDSRNDCNAIIETASNTIIAGCKNTIIPNSVTGIGRNAFYGCSGLTSVTIPNSVTSIGERAFNASGLTSVTIPGSVTSIGYYAFQGCSKLTSVISEIKQPFTLYAHACSFDYISNQCVLTVPVGKRDAYIAKGWTTDVFQGGIVEETNLYCGYCGDGVIYTYDETTKTLTIEGNNAMADYSDPSLCPWYSYRGDIQTLVIKDGVTSIGEKAFFNCSSLTSVTIQNSVTSIGSYAFYGCSGLAEIKVANGNSVYDSRNDCNAIIETSTNTLIVGCKNTIIPNSVTSIGERAFYGCSGLTSVTIPNSVTSIGTNAFCYCSGLTSVTIPNSVTSISSLAFGECSGLTSVTIPNSVTSIDSYAFYGCSGLTSVTIPNSVTSIGTSAFTGCSGLTSVTIPNSVTSIGEYAFYECSGLTSVTIPNSVTSIASAAFYNCSGLTSVTIPNSVTSIGASAFSGCSGLTSVTIPNSVTNIDEGAFYGCSGLTSVTIGNSVTSIGNYAFENCSGLTSVTIPNSVTSIGSYAFNRCSGLTSVKVMRKEPPTIEHNSFSDVSNILLYVPYGSKAKYEAAEYWGSFNIRMLSDSNGDDAINEIDYSGVANYIMGDTPAEFDAEACDVDGNGTVDVRDYVGIANIISTGSIYGGANNNAKAAMSKGMAMPATDESDAENVIYVENVSGSKNSQVELSVRMRNVSDIRGFQFDLYLPEGVSMATNAKASLSSDRLAAGDAHTLKVNEVSDGAVRFLCSSMNDESFAVGDGEIATLTVNIADNVVNGDYDVVVKNALMTETDISKSYEADNIKSTLTVLDQTGVETVTADNERRDGTIYTVGGQLVGKKATTSQLRKGIYIRNGRKIVVK